MCGRYVSATSPEKLAEEFHVDVVKADELPAKYNVAPTDPVYAIAISRDGLRQLGTFKWGLVPSWAKDPSIGSRMINARAETVWSKPPSTAVAESAAASSRPTASTSGSPRRKKASKQPFFIRRADGKPLALAGLWEVWKPRDEPDAEWLRSATIITGEPNELVAPLHDRMPVILPEAAWDTWLDRENSDVDALRRAARALPGGADGGLPGRHHGQQREERRSRTHRTVRRPRGPPG